MRATQCARPAATLAFVEQLEGLSVEIRTAMAAIAGDRLTAFEQSVSRQEVLCGRLQPTASIARSATAGEISAADRELAARLRTATRNLEALNLEYAALLRHCGRSVQLMAALTHNYAQPEKQAGRRAKRQTWSCEG